MHAKNRDTKALVVKTTKHEKDGEKTIFVLERWTLNNNQLAKYYDYVGDSFNTAANLFDNAKKIHVYKPDIVCLRIVQLVLTEFLQTIRADEIALWIITDADGNKSKESFLESIPEVPFNYVLERKE